MIKKRVLFWIVHKKVKNKFGIQGEYWQRKGQTSVQSSRNAGRAWRWPGELRLWISRQNVLSSTLPSNNGLELYKHKHTYNKNIDYLKDAANI